MEQIKALAMCNFHIVVKANQQPAFPVFTALERRHSGVNKWHYINER